MSDSFDAAIHVLHVENGIRQCAALPEGVAVNEQDVGCCNKGGSILELIVSIDITDWDMARKTISQFRHVVEQGAFIQITSVQDFVATSCNIDDPFVSECNQLIDLCAVLRWVATEPGTRERLESKGFCRTGNQFVAFCCRERSNPIELMCEDAEAPVDLRLTQLITGLLVLGIGTKSDPVHFLLG